MTTHILKCQDVYYDAIARGEKNFEVRRDDRGFQNGDIVELQRCVKGAYGAAYEVERDFMRPGEPAHVMRFRIGWVLTGGQFGIEPGYVVFSLLPIKGPKQ